MSNVHQPWSLGYRRFGTVIGLLKDWNVREVTGVKVFRGNLRECGTASFFVVVFLVLIWRGWGY